VVLLRVLQERHFERVGGRESIRANVRVIAATNRDLHAAVADGTFRADLFYRLNVFPLDVPALRERRSDVPLLVEYFTHRYARRVGKRIRSITQETSQLLRSYDWPGNIRELQNCIERSIIVAKSPTVDVADLPRYLFQQREERFDTARIPAALDEELERIERRFILNALQKTHGVQVKAAELLGITERSLWHRVKKLGIQIVKQPAG